ncbi:GumC family protein [Nitratireductor sp. ZSWI3]|uniref:GumC family protein n=1 Tax=Nitratireductor sp. ZSWI3 TaxID=2966359 RepID=UPI00214F9B67|nr:GumC family protein [Nitratireductor sp. ZSWI3]MCR4268234.1 GumC family protein [Nitratireductor sp. ZSWI3]
MFDADNPGRNGSRRSARSGSLLSMAPKPEARPHPRASLLALPEQDDAARRRADVEAAEAIPRRSREPEPPRRQPNPAAPRNPSLGRRVLDRLFPLPDPAPRMRPAVRPAWVPEPPPEPEVRRAWQDVDEDAWQGAPAKRDASDTDDGYWQPLIDPARVIAGIFRAKWLILATTALGAALGVLVALGTPKMYYAATELLFDPRDLQIVERDLMRGGLPSDATLALIENQVSIITSGTVLTKVVDRLDLADDPEFNGSGGGLMSLVTSPRALVSALLEGRVGEDTAARHSIAVGNLADALDVSRNAKTFIITIGVTTQDADKSALVASTVTEVFQETSGELQSATAGRANREINERLDALRGEVERAERAIAAFKAKNDIVDAQGRLIADDEIVRLNEQLSVARARTFELNARAAAARDLDLDTVLGGALPEQVASPVMTELLAQYASLRQQASRLAVRFGPRHPDRQSIEAEVAGARDEIARELRRVIASNQVELQRAVQLEQDLAARLARLKVQKGDMETERVTLRELEREAAAKRSVYEALLLRARETGQQEGLNTANVSIISQASPPLDPVGPSRSSIAIAGMLLGFFVGVGLGAAGGAMRSLRETMDRRGGETPPTGGGGSGARQAPRRRAESSARHDGRHEPMLGPRSLFGDDDHHDRLDAPTDPGAYRTMRSAPFAAAEDGPLGEIHDRLRAVRREVDRLAARRAGFGQR